MSLTEALDVPPWKPLLFEGMPCLIGVVAAFGAADSVKSLVRAYGAPSRLAVLEVAT